MWNPHHSLYGSRILLYRERSCVTKLRQILYHALLFQITKMKHSRPSKGRNCSSSHKYLQIEHFMRNVIYRNETSPSRILVGYRWYCCRLFNCFIPVGEDHWGGETHQNGWERWQPAPRVQAKWRGPEGTVPTLTPTLIYEARNLSPGTLAQGKSSRARVPYSFRRVPLAVTTGLLFLYSTCYLNAVKIT